MNPYVCCARNEAMQKDVNIACLSKIAWVIELAEKPLDMHLGSCLAKGLKIRRVVFRELLPGWVKVLVTGIVVGEG